DGDTGVEAGRGVDRAAVPVLALVQARQEPAEADRVDLVDAGGFGVVADGWRVAGDGEDGADALGVSAEERGLETHDRRVARPDVRDRLEPGLALDHRR